MRNPRVSPQAIIDQAAQETQGRLGGRHVLAIQDTTILRRKDRQRSIALHATLGVDAEEGSVLGLLHGEILHRKGGKKRHRGERGFADKESARWERGALSAAKRSENALRVTVVGDREADIYALFATCPAEVDLLVRATRDRNLKDGGALFDHLGCQPEAGQMTVDVAAAPGRPARQAVVALRFTQATIVCPKWSADKNRMPAEQTVTVVEAREVNPPSDVPALHWRLVTTHHVTRFDQARWIVALYRKRWTIEELFRVLKTRGFDLERVGILDEPFETLAAATLVAGVSVLQLTRERDGQANRPLEDVFHPDEQPALEATCKRLEGKTAKQKNPHAKGSLAFAAWVCARLGGWTGYYGKPGPIVMLRGLHQFRAIRQGWTLAHDV